MTLLKAFLIIVIALLVLFMTLWEFSRASKAKPDLTPRYFYKEKNFNWPGAWITFIALSIISPFCFLVKSCEAIYCFIIWLFTLGRKPKDESREP